MNERVCVSALIKHEAVHKKSEEKKKKKRSPNLWHPHDPRFRDKLSNLSDKQQSWLRDHAGRDMVSTLPNIKKKKKFKKEICHFSLDSIKELTTYWSKSTCPSF